MERLDVQPEFAQWLPFARSRIRAIRTLNLMYVSQHFAVDGVDIWVRIAGKESYITISGKAGIYQFFASPPAVEIEGISGAIATLIKGSAVGVSATVKLPGYKAKATGSSVEEAPEGKSWPFVPAAAIGSKFLKAKLWQIQGITERAFFPSAEGALLLGKPLVSTWSPASPLHSLNASGGFPDLLSSAVDFTYDIPPIFPGGSPQVPDADWYRRAATLMVDSELYGSRRFIVMVDASNVFHAYPSGVADNDGDYPESTAYNAQNIKTNVAQRFVQKVSAPVPAWVRQQTVVSRLYALDNPESIGPFPEFFQKVPQYQWMFNSACTRACSVLFEDIPGIALDDPAATVPEMFLFRGGPITESLPGLVEFSLAIEITGPEPEDFTFGMAVTRDLQPSVSGKYIMAADYAWPVRDVTALEADPLDDSPPVFFTELDDLVLLTGAIYHPSDVRTSTTNALNIEAMKCIATIENLTQDTVIRKILTHSTNQLYTSEFPDRWFDTTFAVPAGQNYKLATTLIIALDLRILAFVLQQKYVQEDVAVDVRGKSTVAQRLRTYAYNTMVDEIVMDPASALNTVLDTAHADTSTTGMFKFPFTQVGRWLNRFERATTQSLYNGTDILGDGGGMIGGGANYSVSDYSFSNDQFNTYGGDYNVGAYFYARRMASALQLDARATFAIHPNGSYSIATGIVMYHAGPEGNTPAPGTPVDFDADLMRQAYVDIVVLKGRPGLDADGDFSAIGTGKRTTHLALYNSAFGNTFEPADFYPFYGLAFDGAKTRLEITEPNGRVSRYLIRANTAISGEAFTQEPSWRPVDIDHRYAPTMRFSRSIGGGTAQYQVEPALDDVFLNGSALFF